MMVKLRASTARSLRDRVAVGRSGYPSAMERDRPDFDQQDSGVPVTSPDRTPDPLPPEHSVPDPPDTSGVGGSSGATEPVRDDADGEGAGSLEEGPAVPGRGSGLDESNPAQGA